MTAPAGLESPRGLASRRRAIPFLAGGVALLVPLAVARAFCCHLSLLQSRLIFSWLPPAGLLLIGIAVGVWWGSRWPRP